MLVRSDEVQLAVGVVQDGESEFKHLLQETGETAVQGKGTFALPFDPDEWSGPYHSQLWISLQRRSSRGVNPNL